jgi:hypothetical protein
MQEVEKFRRERFVMSRNQATYRRARMKCNFLEVGGKYVGQRRFIIPIKKHNHEEFAKLVIGAKHEL